MSEENQRLEADNGLIRLVVSLKGGSVLHFAARTDAGLMPLFREAPERVASVLQTGCFPLVPFGNRLRDNCFTFDEKEYYFKVNFEKERFYLHGDGWLGNWHVLQHSREKVVLGFNHTPCHGAPYGYEVEQTFLLDGQCLTIKLNLCNSGDAALPFGLGLHPYFPMTEKTVVEAFARSVWDMDEDLLPTSERPLTVDMDFSALRPLPQDGILRLFESWDSKAQICWPERQLALAVEADSLFDRYVLFIPEGGYQHDAGYDRDWFCFEPMSHSIDAQHMASGGGLKRLAPGESLSGSVSFRWFKQ